MGVPRQRPGRHCSRSLLVRALAAESPPGRAAVASTRSGVRPLRRRGAARPAAAGPGRPTSLSSRPWWLLVPSRRCSSGSPAGSATGRGPAGTTLVETRLAGVRSYVLGPRARHRSSSPASPRSSWSSPSTSRRDSATRPCRPGLTQTSFAIGSAVAAPLGGTLRAERRPAAGRRRAGHLRGRPGGARRHGEHGLRRTGLDARARRCWSPASAPG